MDNSKINQPNIPIAINNCIGKINLYTGRLILECPLYQIGNGNFSIGLSMIYNSHYQALNKNTSKWKLNIEQYIIMQNGNKSYIDDIGNAYYFSYDSGLYYNDSGQGLKLTQYDDRYEIIDRYNNKLIFDVKSYKLKSIISGYNANIQKIIEYDNKNNIKAIYDKRKKARQITFDYDDKNNLQNIFFKDESLEFIIQYDENDNMVKIIKKSNNQQKDYLGFIYESNELTYVIDLESQEALNFTYCNSNYKTNKLISKVNIGNVYYKLITKDLKAEKYLGDLIMVEDGVYPTKKGQIVDGYQLSLDINHIKSFKEFIYAKNYTIVSDETTIQFIYYFNQDGQCLSLFEIGKDNQNINSSITEKILQLQTINKQTGFLIINDGNGKTKINGHNSVIIEYNQNNSSYLYELDNNLIERFNLQNDKYNENYSVSFYVKLNKILDRKCRVNVVILTNYSQDQLFYQGFLEKTDSDVWQLITIPIKLSWLDNILSMYIEFLDINDNEAQIEIANLRINVAEYLEYQFEEICLNNLVCVQHIGANYRPISEEKYSFNIQYTKGGSDYINEIGPEFYLTENDLFETYKNLYQKKGEKFYLVCLNNTKFIEVENVALVVNVEKKENNKIVAKEKHTVNFTIKDQGSSNYYRKVINHLNKTDIGEKHFNFIFNQNDYTIKQSSCKIYDANNIYFEENLSANIYTTYDYNGNLIRIIDEYNVVYENSYDEYGNLIINKTYNKANSNKSIATVYKYDSEVEELREALVSITKDGTSVQYQYNNTNTLQVATTSNQGTNNYHYDIFKEKIVNISQNDYYNVNNIKYDKGLILSYYSNFTGIHSFRYNALGECIKYYYNQNLIYSNKIGREEPPRINYIENKYYSQKNPPVIKIVYNDYGLPIEIDEDNLKKVSYTYEELSNGGSKLYTSIKSVKDDYADKIYSYEYTNNRTTIIQKKQNSDEEYELKIVKTPSDILYSYSEKDVVECQLLKEDYQIKDENEAGVVKLLTNPKIVELKNKEPQDGILADIVDICYNYEYDYLGRLSIRKTTPIKYPNYIIYLNKKTNYLDNSSLINKIEYEVISSKLNKNEVSANFFYTAEYENGLITAIKEEGERFIENPKDQASQSKSSINPKVITYTYDQFGRIIEESSKSDEGNNKISYEYNSDLMLSKVVKNGKVIKEFQNKDGKLINANIDNIAYEINYDNVGNIQQIINKTEQEETILKYNARNQLETFKKGSSAKITYKYNYKGIRVEKNIEGNKKVKYYLDNDKIIGEEWLDTNNNITHQIRYFYDLEGICGLKYDGYYFLLIKDILGNINKIMYRGKIIGEYLYDAWGNCEVVKLSISNDRDKFVLYNNPFRYKGYYCDLETGYFWLSSRYYSPELGRFIQPADVSSLNPSNINGLNLYSYANNNPINIHYNTTLASAGIVGGGMVSSIGSSVGGGAISGSGGGGSSSPSRNLPSVPGWLGTLSTGLDHGFTMINPIRSAIACLQFTDLWDLMRLDGVTELPGALSKVATGIGWGLSIAGGVIAGYEKYASGASLSSSIAGGLINAGISIGGMYASTAIATAAMGALAASSLAIPGGVIIVGGAVIAVVAGIAINHLFTKLEIGGNTIEGHLNNFVDWLIFWD